MSTEFREKIYKELNLRETDELLSIWKTNDHVEWSDIAFDVIKEILNKRIGNVPLQNEPILEHEEQLQKNDNLEDWEVKVLDDNNQPELYDTLEVLSVKDNINKVAKVFVVVNILFALLNFQTFRELLQGTFPSIDQLPSILWSLFVTILVTGIDIVIVYFPLKALNQILRILMEMEFNSRKAK